MSHNDKSHIKDDAQLNCVPPPNCDLKLSKCLSLQTLEQAQDLECIKSLNIYTTSTKLSICQIVSGAVCYNTKCDITGMVDY